MIPAELQMPDEDEEDDESAAMRRRCAFWAADDDDEEEEEEEEEAVEGMGKDRRSHQPTCPPLERPRNCGKVLTNEELQNLISLTEESLFRNLEGVINEQVVPMKENDPDAEK